MNIKQVLKYVGVFSLFFFLTMFIVFPYTKVVDGILSEALIGTEISYKSLTSGMFRTKINDIKAQDIDVGDLVVKYTPFSILTRSVKGELDSLFGEANGKVGTGGFDLSAAVDIGMVAKLLKESASGLVYVKTEYDFKDKKGTFSIDGGNFSIKTPVTELSGDTIKGDGFINDKTLTINSFNIEGKNKLTLAGQIKLDTTDIKKSILSLNGEGQLIKGMTMKFVIRGTIERPQLTY